MNPLEKIIAALKKKVAPAPKPAPTPQPVRQSFATQKQSIAPPIPMPAPAPQRQTVTQPRQVINTKVTKVAAKPNIIQKGISNLKGNIKNFQDDDFKMYGPKVVGEQVAKLLRSKSPVKSPMDIGQDFLANAAGGLTEAGVASVTVPRSKKATTAEKAGAFIGGVGAVTAPVQSVQIGTLTSALKKALNRDKPMDLEGDIASGTKTAGVLKATGPIVSKVLGKVASRVPKNSLVATGGTKAIQSGLNVAEGLVIDKATGMPTTPASVAIDAITGAAGGPNIRGGNIKGIEVPNAKGVKQNTLDMGDVEEIGNIYRRMSTNWTKDGKPDLDQLTKDSSLVDLILKDKYGGNDKDLRRPIQDKVETLFKIAQEEAGILRREGIKMGIKGADDTTIQEARKYKSAEEFVASQTKQEYRSAHQLGLSDSITADKIDIPTLKEGIRSRNGYLNNYNLKDLKRLEKLQSNPDAEITIYRASPKNELNDGDWVTTDKTYANDIKRQNGGKVYSYTAKVKDLRFPKDLETLPSLSMASTFSYSPKTSKLTDIYNQATKSTEPPKGPMMGFSSIKDSGTGISQMARETANQSAKDAGVAPIDSRQANYTPLKESLINKNPTLRSTPEWGAEKSRLRNPKTAQNVASLSDTIVRSKDIDVKSKVNLVDYLRTPDRVLTKMGLAPEAKLIRQKYDDYLKDLPKEIDKITAWSKQVSPESNRRIFQHLDGQKVQLDAQEAKVAGEVQTYLKEWANKLGLPEDGRIASYITHIFEKDFIQKEFDPELASLIRDKIPGSVYDPFLQERLGKQGYIEDTWRALDAYVKRATRKFHMDPALEKVSAKAEALEESQFSYVKSYVDRINLRPTKLDNLMDNTVKSVIGYKLGARPVAYVSRLMRQAVFRGALGLNVGSALKNLTQGANTYAKLGEKYTAVGYANLVKSVLNGSKELEEVGILRDNFIQDRALSATKQTLQKVDKVLFALFETAERINRGSAYFGAKAKGLSEGMNEKEAIEYARNIVRDTQFTFGSVDTPILLQSDIGKTVAQFQSFTLKQTEFLAELAKNKDYAGLLRYTAGSLAMVYSVGQLFGMEPKDMIPAFRVGIPPTLKTPVAIAQAVMGTPDQYGNVPDTKERIENVGASMTTLIPGGVQLKKTLEGAGTVKQGYDTTKSGLVKYPVEQTPENYVRGGLFGKYNLPESKGYEKSGYLREADSAAIKQLPPEKRQDFYKDQLDERAMDKVIKEKNEQKKAAIDAYLDGDETKAAALQAKHGITVKQEDIKRRQTEYKNKAIDAYLDGAEDTAASIQGKYGLDVKQADIQKRAKSRAITLYKRYLLTKNPKYEKQAADLQGTYGFQVKKEEIE